MTLRHAKNIPGDPFFDRTRTIRSPDGVEFSVLRRGDSVAIIRGQAAMILPAGLIAELRGVLLDLEGSA